MERWQNKIAVVTGAGAGIGAAIAKALINAGVVVVGLDIRPERIEDLKQGLPADRRSRLTAIKCDVSKLDSVNEAFDEIIRRFAGVDILINNAGCYRSGQLSTTDVQVLQDVLQTNVMGVVYCTQRAFKSMKERKFDGHVVLINSLGGHKVPVFGEVVTSFNIYPPSKHALTAINEIYHQEFAGFGTKIKVTSISPGVVDTEMVPDHIKSIIGERILQSEDVASAALFAIATPPHVQMHEMIIKSVGEIY